MYGSVGVRSNPSFWVNKSYFFLGIYWEIIHATGRSAPTCMACRNVHTIIRNTEREFRGDFYSPRPG